MIVKSGRVVAASVNTFRNNPEIVSEKHVKRGCSVHAEVNALKRAGENARGATVYVARNTGNEPSLSRPCNNCYEALASAGVKEVIYT